MTSEQIYAHIRRSLFLSVILADLLMVAWIVFILFERQK